MQRKQKYDFIQQFGSAAPFWRVSTEREQIVQIKA